ncbi:hypothetical protein, partial [Agromyces humi]|uniref:hypothetical protein n=1 Tax=Agromyces humi TaxID=1766800 RepID=UPI0038B2B78A
MQPPRTTGPLDAAAITPAPGVRDLAGGPGGTGAPGAAAVGNWKVLAATLVVLVLWASAFIAIRGIGDALTHVPDRSARHAARAPPFPRHRSDAAARTASASTVTPRG